MRALRGNKLLLVQLSVFTALALTGSGMVYRTLTNAVPGDTRSFRAVFVDVSGLDPGDDVRMAGVKVGRVDRVERRGSRALVAFRVRADHAVRQDTMVAIRYQNLIGQRFLSLVGGPGDAPPQPENETIPVERTRPALNLSQLFNGFAPLFQALDSHEINRLSEHLVRAVQGSGPELHALMKETSQVTRKLGARDEIIGAVITNLASTLDHLAGKGEEFDAVVAQMRRLVGAFRASSALFVATMDSADRVARRANGLLADIGDDVPGVVRRFNGVASTYLDVAEELAATLGELPRFLGRLAKITMYGSWLNVYACRIEVNLRGTTVPFPQPEANSEVCR